MTLKYILAVSTVAIALAFHPGAASAQNNGIGGDGYTRALWRGTDGSISLWKLDPSLNFGGSHSYGPYPGWSSVALTTTANSNSYVLWRNTDGTATIWVVDPNLNFITSHNYGPYEGWIAMELGIDP
jgi:hypothetical protein